MENSWKNPFVRAGVDHPGYVAEVVGLHPEIFFRYRRPGPKETEKQMEEFQNAAKQSAEKGIESIQEFLGKRLCSWQYGNVTKDAIEALTHSLLLRVYWIVLQTSPTDPIPTQFLKPDEDTSAAEVQAKK